jgi:alternate signal-mediated exported protein
MSTTPSPDHAPVPRARTRAGARTKGIVAIAAGTALLLGGGGTYAYWSTQQALTAGTVESGDLDLALGSGTWTIQGVLDGAPTAVADPANVRIVPGDVLTLTQPVTVTLVGDTIEADLAVSAADIVPAPLAQYMTVDFTSTGLGTATGVNTYRVTPATAGTVTATVTITFSSTTPDRVAVNTPVDLDNISFALTQATS